ncbi:MAG: pyridoxamine 5'-phosphate oxidase [Rhodospirillaceae bacterium]|nr:pyridoxamine 5'-phosphate oxidase [Rhodospirillaceae bacterium]|tara:strand:- start:44296 stop:44886 length:591 start_codon:yes stop_codon:yes gene_type:complete
MVESGEVNPQKKFKDWYEEAEKAEPGLAEAMTLATVNASGMPSARMVLLKEANDRGFVFYTNLDSKKGKELAENPKAALVFHWKSLKRQVRISGNVEPVSAEEADAYFESRPRGAQIGAWASDQSKPMDGQFDLEKKVALFTAKFGVSKIDRPPYWSGFCVIPSEFEFWEERPFRLHRRIMYRIENGEWSVTHLFP